MRKPNTLKIVEDSYDNENQDKDRQSILKNKQKTHENDVTWKKLGHSKYCVPSTSSGSKSKNLIDLNKYPKEDDDLGYQNEALSNDVICMLKIYFDYY